MEPLRPAGVSSRLQDGVKIGAAIQGEQGAATEPRDLLFRPIPIRLRKAPVLTKRRHDPEAVALFGKWVPGVRTTFAAEQSAQADGGRAPGFSE